MTSLTVVGGVYRERCIWPEWDRIFGSAGRAAACLSEHVDEIILRSYATEDTRAEFDPYAQLYGFTFRPSIVDQAISFEYVHCLSTPIVRPSVGRIRANVAIEASAENILVFGMLEGSARVTAERCVYDPQSAFKPEWFTTNGSRAAKLAIVANRSEILALSGREDPEQGARSLLDRGAEVVVVKSGPAGAFIIEAGSEGHVPAYASERVWTIGSGDVFAAVFAARWCVHRDRAEVAADLASRAVAAYAESMSLPSASGPDLAAANRRPTAVAPGRVYLAGPFFTLGQRWVVDEARQALTSFGLDVFSPVHDVGRGPAHVVAPADLDALQHCDRVLAIVDGTDSGTLFEIGYARARGIPVYALAQAVVAEDLKMITGSGCKLFDDFVTAIHHTAWLA